MEYHNRWYDIRRTMCVCCMCSNSPDTFVVLLVGRSVVLSWYTYTYTDTLKWNGGAFRQANISLINIWTISAIFVYVCCVLLLAVAWDWNEIHFRYYVYLTVCVSVAFAAAPIPGTPNILCTFNIFLVRIWTHICWNAAEQFFLSGARPQASTVASPPKQATAANSI